MTSETCIEVTVFIADYMPGQGTQPIWAITLMSDRGAEVLDGAPDIWTAYRIASEHSAKRHLPINFDLSAEGLSALNLCR